MAKGSTIIEALVVMLVLEMVSSFGCLPRPSALSQCARTGESSMRRNFWSQISNSRPSSCRSTAARRLEVTCGLQVTVRIRGKKSRDDDYTNQVETVFVALRCWLGCHPVLNIHPYCRVVSIYPVTYTSKYKHVPGILILVA